MNALQLNDYGVTATDNVEHVDVTTPEPGREQVVVQLLAATINPSDLLLISGRYGYRPQLPALLGAEGVGRIVAVGDGVDAARIGEQVLILPTLANTTWREETVVAADEAIAVTGDPHQLAMLGINPMTAWAMLFGVVDLPRGARVAQTGATSATAGYVRTLARQAGLRVIDIVRRPESVAALQADGAETVLLDGPELGTDIDQVLGGQSIDLLLDSVGGPSTTTLASRVTAGGTVLVYASRRGEPVSLSVPDLIFRGVTLRGFWLKNWQETLPPEQLAARYRELAGLVADGTLHADVEATYALSEYEAALTHAKQGGRKGKVLFAFDA